MLPALLYPIAVLAVLLFAYLLFAVRGGTGSIEQRLRTMWATPEMGAVTLVEASRNAQTDLDVQVIDEFRKESAILDSLIFDPAVNPAGGGATLTYGYRRLVTQATADFRQLNTEYTPSEVTTTHETVQLVPLGGAFEIDRVLARVGPAASGAVALNLSQKIKATRTRFQDAVINGDTAVEEHGFDGLDEALAGSDTEFRPTTVTDWSGITSEDDSPHQALDDLDEFLSLLDGTPTVVVGNNRAIAKVRSIARRAGQYTRNPIDGLLGPDGRPIVRETYGGVTFVDAGTKAGSNDPIVPIRTATVGDDEDPTTGLTDLYAYRVGLDGFHGVTTVGSPLVETWLPDFSSAGAVKKGEVEMGPVAVALKATKAAAVFRHLKVA